MSEIHSYKHNITSILEVNQTKIFNEIVSENREQLSSHRDENVITKNKNSSLTSLASKAFNVGEIILFPFLGGGVGGGGWIIF